MITPNDGLALLALSVFAVYRQTRTMEIVEKGRFKMALIYAVIGVALGGQAFPDWPSGWVFR